jgi:hypothetical protein
MESSSSSHVSGNQLIHMDLEHNVTEGGERQRSRLVRVWKVPLPIRKAYLVSDLIKNIAFIMTLL